MTAKRGVADLTPAGYVAIRFGVSVLVSLSVACRIGWRASGPVPMRLDSSRARMGALLAGLALGAFSLAGSLAHFAGAQYTSSSNSAFIVGLTVITVPIIEVLVSRRRPSTAMLGAIAITTVGLFFLSGATGVVAKGDLITLAAPVFFGLWMVLAGYFTRRFPVYVMMTVSGVFGTAVCLIAAFTTGFGRITLVAVLCAVIPGVLGVAIDGLNMWALARIEPSRAGVLFLIEPLTASAIGFVAGERIGVTGVIGAALMLGGMALVELGGHRRSAPAQAAAADEVGAPVPAGVPSPGMSAPGSGRADESERGSRSQPGFDGPCDLRVDGAGLGGSQSWAVPSQSLAPSE
ncbi:MAG: DMT family transporter [Acidimicrobiia bacterium]